MRYDLKGKQFSPLVTLDGADEGITLVKYSPQGDQFAYVVQKGDPTSGLRYALSIYDLERNSGATVLEGNLGNLSLAWSPDGGQLALLKKAADEPDIISADTFAQNSINNLWLLTLSDLKMEPLTMLAASRLAKPMWTQDGSAILFQVDHQYLAGVTLDSPGDLWQVTELPEFPEEITFFVLP